MADRPTPPDPYQFLPQVPEFTVTSTDLTDGGTVPQPHTSGMMGAGGEDRSPQLSWSGFPEGTRGFAVTVYDPTRRPPAASGTGWSPASPPRSPSCPPAPGTKDSPQLPEGAVQLRNDAGFAGYIGAAPRRATGRTATTSSCTPSTPTTWALRPTPARPSTGSTCSPTPSPAPPWWRPSSSKASPQQKDLPAPTARTLAAGPCREAAQPATPVVASRAKPTRS